MRHSASLSLAHIQAVAFGDATAKNTLVKFLGDDQVVDRYDEMIQ
jgi:hypothetical protein